MSEPEVPKGRVAIILPNGKFDTIDAKYAHEVPAAGGRILTKQEIAEHALAEEYAKKSTAQKALGVGSVALGPIGANAAAASGATALQPEVESFNQGWAEPATLGLDKVAVQKGLEATQGDAAGKAYAEHQQAIAEAHPDWQTAGQVAGFAGLAAGGSAGGAARLLPGAGVSALGGAAEQYAARTVAKIAGKSVLGKAATSAAGLGARGLVEGAVYAGAHEGVEEQLRDHELASDKIFAAMGTGALYGGAGGAALGGAGSLAASAARGTAGAVGRGLSRVMSKGDEAVAEGLAKEGAVEGATHEAAALPASAAGGAPSPGSKITSVQDHAYDRSWRALGGSKANAREAEKYLARGHLDVGEVNLRYGTIDKNGKVVDVALEGKPDAILAKFAAPIESVGKKLGDIYESSGARIPAERIEAAAESILTPLSKKAGFHNIGSSVADYTADLYQKLGIQVDAQTGKVLPKQSVSFGDAMFQRQALDELVYREGMPLNPSARIQEMRELRGAYEKVLMDELDSASGKVRGDLAAEVKSLKHDYTALKIGEKAAVEGATKGVANRTFSPTAKLVGTAVATAGTAIGGPVGLVAGPAAAVVTKTIQERGDAVAAVLLNRMANSAAMAKTVGTIDSLIDRASKGLLVPPPKKALPIGMPPNPRKQAIAAMERVAQYQADPERLVDHVMQQTEAMGAHSPEIANGVTQRMVSAYAFLASKMPATSDPDPLDPHPRPSLSDSQAATFAKYDWYTEQPSRFFVEVAHGKITPEGAETAQALMPRAFAELQAMTVDALSTQMARGNKIPFQQRLVLGSLLNFAAVPSQRPAHAAMLQYLLVSAQNPPSPPAPKSGSSSSKSAVTQQSAMDRLEASGPGKR